MVSMTSVYLGLHGQGLDLAAHGSVEVPIVIAVLEGLALGALQSIGIALAVVIVGLARTMAASMYLSSVSYRA